MCVFMAPKLSASAQVDVYAFCAHDPQLHSIVFSVGPFTYFPVALVSNHQGTATTMAAPTTRSGGMQTAQRCSTRARSRRQQCHRCLRCPAAALCPPLIWMKSPHLTQALTPSSTPYSQQSSLWPTHKPTKLLASRGCSWKVRGVHQRRK